MIEEPLYYLLARFIGPCIPDCLRKIRHLGSVRSGPGETKLQMPSYCQTDWYSRADYTSREWRKEWNPEGYGLVCWGK